MSRHIKGPWTLGADGSTIIAADGFPVAAVDGYPVLQNWADLGIGHWSEAPEKAYIERTKEEVLATAQIIAAAPDMLEALGSAEMAFRFWDYLPKKAQDELRQKTAEIVHAALKAVRG